MKKICILLYLSLVFIVNIAARPSIIMDKTTDSVRIIQTERTSHVFPYKKAWTDCGLSLICIKNINTQETYYEIQVYIYDRDTEIAKGNRLLLKLKNDDIITLFSRDFYSPEEIERRSNIFGAVLDRTYVVVPCYAILEDQINEIINSNVTKVRVETLDDQFDGNVYNTKFSNCIRDDYNLIQSVIENDKSIYDDF